MSCIRLYLCLPALAPEVGANLINLALLYPSVDDGFYYRRLIVSEAQGYQILLRELLGQRIQIADVTLASLRAQRVVVQGIDFITLDLQLIMQTTLRIPEGELDGALRFLATFQQIGDDASTEAVEGSTTAQYIE